MPERSRGLDVSGVPHGEDLAAHHPRVARGRADPDREDLGRRAGSEDGDEEQRQQQDREGEHHLDPAADDPVDPLVAEPGEGAEDDRDADASAVAPRPIRSDSRAP